jgi:hypothetical protein
MGVGLRFRQGKIPATNGTNSPKGERGRHGEEAKSQVLGALCDKVFSLRLWLFVSFVAAFSLYCLNHRASNRANPDYWSSPIACRNAFFH